MLLPIGDSKILVLKVTISGQVHLLSLGGLGSPDAMAPSWFSMDYHEDALAYPLPDSVYFEPQADAEWNLPLPSDQQSTAELVVDSAGEEWLAVRQEHRQVVYFNMKTSSEGRPAQGRTRYPSWMLRWDRGQGDVVDIYRHPPQR